MDTLAPSAVDSVADSTANTTISTYIFYGYQALNPVHNPPTLNAGTIATSALALTIISIFTAILLSAPNKPIYRPDAEDAMPRPTASSPQAPSPATQPSPSPPPPPRKQQHDETFAKLTGFSPSHRNPTPPDPDTNPNPTPRRDSLPAPQRSPRIYPRVPVPVPQQHKHKPKPRPDSLTSQSSDTSDIAPAWHAAHPERNPTGQHYFPDKLRRLQVHGGHERDEVSLQEGVDLEMQSLAQMPMPQRRYAGAGGPASEATRNLGYGDVGRDGPSRLQIPSTYAGSWEASSVDDKRVSSDPY
ncbi:hypothetical protein K491DRAFT_689439 [Lophiostoma macrostomum CBS 122681]|uniref:Uncharacterized protein n=1 Tax=Lophiostoma macrostomum CBS 122681 TaxID=1314788 RepID=A0A6A6TK37_9PLEO|nr:hypothetical protein K491DRAFT_689439 [Lophiostoma macrostomum CBS 122681]